MKAACRSAPNKFIRAERAFVAPIVARVAQKRHHYDELDIGAAVPSRGAKLAETIFAGRLGERWEGLDGIPGPGSESKWYSPGANHINDHISDLFLAKFFNRYSWWGKLDFLWIRCLINQQGLIVTSKQNSDGQWVWVVGEVGRGRVV